MINLNLSPSEKELKQFAFGQLIFCLVISAWLFFFRESQTAPAVIMAVSVCLFILSRINPGVLKYPFLVLSIVAFPIGWVISHVVLTVVYFLVITPIGLIMKIAGYDPLERKLDPKAESYWKKRDEKGALERYFKQY